MQLFDSLKILGFDHLEFAVADLEKSSELYLRLGFEKVASRAILPRKLKSHLFVSGSIQILISQSDDSSDPVAQFVASHGDGIIDIAFHCENAYSTFESCVRRGATVCYPPKAYTRDFGSLEFASIKAFGNIRHTFISRRGNFFAESFGLPIKSHSPTYALNEIDHLGINVEREALEKWLIFYEKIFGLERQVTSTESGQHFHVLQSPTRGIRFTFNAPRANRPQIQEFITIYHGSGVEHVGFQSTDMFASVERIRKEGIKCVEVPPTYFQNLKSSQIHLTENLSILERLGILVDVESGGYLLQTSTERVVGPLFFEFLQRKGNLGYGDASYSALATAIDQDRIRRGILDTPEPGQ